MRIGLRGTAGQEPDSWSFQQTSTDTAESPDDIEQGGVIHPPPASSADKARLFQNFLAYQDREGASGSYWEGRCVCKSRRYNPRA
jgi:hypothetical protein